MVLNIMFSFFKTKEKQPVYLYNTLSKKKELFVPLKKGCVSFYQCGPTVYWTQHIGNLRAAVLGDIIRRTFEYVGYKVNFVRNYTDVGHLVSDGDSGEDKMEKGVKREGLSPLEIANKYIRVYEDDSKDLNIINPTQKPRATDYIKEIQALTQILLDKGYAYSTPLAIYFDISKVTDYTKLSGQKLSENISGAGTGQTEDPEKKNPADFSIWFFKAGQHKNALQYWPSDFSSPLVKNGEGFPGWHIECSAMSKKLLGKTIDIHMGGVEHIPVHHTNEIAQSECANKAPLAHYWLHNEWLMVNNGKMSKSEGTAYSLAEIKERALNPLSLRYFYLQANYRSKQNFTWEAMQASETGYSRLIENVASLGATCGVINTEFKEKFLSAITDDFNTPLALATTQEVLKSNLLDTDKLATILDFDRVLGLDLAQAIKYSQLKTIIPREVQALLDERKKARENKDYKKSDELRDQILALGFEVKDK